MWPVVLGYDCYPPTLEVDEVTRLQYNVSLCYLLFDPKGDLSVEEPHPLSHGGETETIAGTICTRPG